MPNLNVSTEVIITTTDNDTGAVVEIFDDITQYNATIVQVGDIIVTDVGVVTIPSLVGSDWKAIYVKAGVLPKGVYLTVTYTVNFASSLVKLFSGDMYSFSRNSDISGTTANSTLTGVVLSTGGSVGSYSVKYVIVGNPTVNG